MYCISFPTVLVELHHPADLDMFELKDRDCEETVVAAVTMAHSLFSRGSDWVSRRGRWILGGERFIDGIGR